MNLRILLLSTPRTGNTWVRNIVSAALGVPGTATHPFGEAEWAAMPESVVHQTHQPCTAEFAARAEREGCRVLTIARHPFDTLLSILQFARHEPETAFWLDGLHGNERPVHEADPTSDAFLDYATGPRARALLDITRGWWPRPGVVRVRYEDCVANPVAALHRVAEQLGVELVGAPAEAADAHTLAKARQTVVNRHFWQGNPGHWRSLLTAREVAVLADAHADLLSELGYPPPTPDPALTADQAARNWQAVTAG